MDSIDLRKDRHREFGGASDERQNQQVALKTLVDFRCRAWPVDRNDREVKAIRKAWLGCLSMESGERVWFLLNTTQGTCHFGKYKADE